MTEKKSSDLKGFVALVGAILGVATAFFGLVEEGTNNSSHTWASLLGEIGVLGILASMVLLPVAGILLLWEHVEPEAEESTKVWFALIAVIAGTIILKYAVLDGAGYREWVTGYGGTVDQDTKTLLILSGAFTLGLTVWACWEAYRQHEAPGPSGAE